MLAAPNHLINAYPLLQSRPIFLVNTGSQSDAINVTESRECAMWLKLCYGALQCVDVLQQEASAVQRQGSRILLARQQSAAHDAQMALERDAKQVQCVICTETHQQGQMHSVACGQNDHIYCVNCIAQHCSTQLLDVGTVPRCPGSECSYELPGAELTAIWSVSTYDNATDCYCSCCCYSICTIAVAAASLMKSYY
jgi:hypothetical protein